MPGPLGAALGDRWGRLLGEAAGSPGARLPGVGQGLGPSQVRRAAQALSCGGCLPGQKAAARPRWHRRRRPRTRRAHFAALPVHVSGLAGFLVEVG
jgi:hypothetical protein